MAKSGGQHRRPEGRRLLAPSRRLPTPANDNAHPAGRQRQILAAFVVFALMLLVLLFRFL